MNGTSLYGLPATARLPPLHLLDGSLVALPVVLPIPVWGPILAALLILLLGFVSAVLDEVLHEGGVHEEQLLDVALLSLLIRVDLKRTVMDGLIWFPSISNTYV